MDMPRPKPIIYKKVCSLSTSAVVAMLLSVLTISCSKHTVDADSAFIGVYTGTDTYSGTVNADTVTVAAGSTPGSVVMLSRAAQATSYTIYGTVAGSTLTVYAQSVNIFGGTDSISGVGAVNDTMLTINYSVSNAGVPVNLNFTGTRH
jgi:hypothetical protein